MHSVSAGFNQTQQFPSPRHARLVLSDGSVYEGRSIGVPGTTFGELMFNTGVTGYQEVLTDPSYNGQLVMLTTPEVGNYGVNLQDYQSSAIHLNGFVVTRLSPYTSSWRAEISLQEFLVKNGIVGIEGVDTRALTLKIRDEGEMMAAITTTTLGIDELVAQIHAAPKLAEQDLVGQVCCKQPYTLIGRPMAKAIADGAVVQHFCLVDFGVKRSIIDYLLEHTHQLTVLPGNRTTYNDIVALKPDGVMLSNGPGDPSILAPQIELARQLVQNRVPTVGICLGHQLLGLASGATMKKMPFGHHGGNHPVQDVETGQIFITSQNHGYAADLESLPDQLKVTHVNLNDGSVEGFRHLQAPVMSVQFHPEANPGPHDANVIFTRFMQAIVTAAKSTPTALAGV
ncbi:MAG: glutamine-hydrolyzing carbamoyl-phosphate synthase small subunit [Cyanobacteria bacterium HKST-UBA06]|nr:glutamine-hydrolyzing carbamoyl-phosphate synthase small subunit [Cyanobacteria bacterium HKST-UBA06]